MSRKIASHYALIDDKLARNIVITTDDEGRIIAIDEITDIDRCAGVEFYPGILIPGMVNAHCHLELSYLADAIAEGSGFAGFAREIGRVRGNYTDDVRCHAADIADATMWEEGVQAVADIANDGLVMEIKERSRIEYVTMFEHFGLMNLSTERVELLAAQHRGFATPHSTYSVQDTPFRRLCSKGEGPISLHFLESKDEIKLYSGSGSLTEWYARMGWECDFIGYGSPAERIAKSIDPSRKLMLVHCCHATRQDVEVLNSSLDTPPTWVLCPESNRYISQATPPANMLRDMGCRIAIGTDSRASARHLSMVENIYLLEDIPLEELLVWATKNGAIAIGKEQELGSIKIGKRPGLVVIENANLVKMKLTKESKSKRIL